MAKVNILELRSIVVAGGSVIVDASNYSTLELRSLAVASKYNGGKVVIQKAYLLNSIDCRSIAVAGDPGNVIFNFTE